MERKGKRFYGCLRDIVDVQSRGRQRCRAVYPNFLRGDGEAPREVGWVVDGGQTEPVAAARTSVLDCAQTARTAVRYIVVRVSREVAGASAGQGIGIVNLESTFQTRAPGIDLIRHLSIFGDLRDPKVPRMDRLMRRSRRCGDGGEAPDAVANVRAVSGIEKGRGHRFVDNCGSRSHPLINGVVVVVVVPCTAQTMSYSLN